MEAKNTANRNLQRYRSLFFLAGLVVALSACIIAFNWKSQVQIEREIAAGTPSMIEQEQIPITQPEEERMRDAAPPAAPQVIERMRLVEREVILDREFDPFDNEFNLNAAVPVYSIQEGGAPEEDEIDEEPIVFFADEMPTFQGGSLDKFREYIRKNTNYPPVAAEHGVQGQVRVSFVIERDGTVTNVKIIRGVDPLLDQEALRVVKSSPRWTPGRQRGKPARVGYNIPVVFYLN